MSRPTKKTEPWMEVEGMEKTTNEGQIILLGKNIEEEDKGEDEEADTSDDDEGGKCYSSSQSETHS